MPIGNLKDIGLSKQKIKYIHILAKEWPMIDKKFADIGVFSDAESIVPSKVAPLLKRIIAYQQTAYAEFISGNRNLNEWDEFVEQFQKIGGSKVLETMRGYYKSMKIINSQVDSIFVSLIQ